MAVEILVGDCRNVLRSLSDESVHCVVTSPPYFGLRDYGVPGQIGLEGTPEAFVSQMVEVFREVRRVLRDDGTLWLNLGDSYSGGASGSGWREGSARADGEVRTDGESRRNRNGIGRVQGLKPKDLIGIPWRVAFALQADGWYLRSSIIWHKPNPMPESVTDRPTSAHENLFLLAKSERYFYDAAAVRERAECDRRRGPAEHADRVSTNGNGGLSRRTPEEFRNLRNVWTVATQPFSGAHFATFPPDLIEPCIKAGCPAGGTVLDPFGGAGTTGLVADRLGRNAQLVELNPSYAEMARDRLIRDGGMLINVHIKEAA